MRRAVTLLLALTTNLLAQHDRLGLPACPTATHELTTHEAFTLCHSSTFHTPAWTAYELTPTLLAASQPLPRHHFRKDPTLTQSAADTDYRHSGYSRSHMVPASDLHFSPTATRQSFYLSNAVPQLQSVNAGLWRQLELTVRNLAKTSDSVIILSGPIYDSPQPATIGANQVAVPTATYKVIAVFQQQTLALYAAIIPNQPNQHQSLQTFSTTIDQVEARTNLDFFPTLTPNQQTTLHRPLP